MSPPTSGWCTVVRSSGAKWYAGVTAYMWLVLAIGSLGWVFDTFEGQIFVASMKEAMPALLPEGTPAGSVDLYNNIAMAALLVGGAWAGWSLAWSAIVSAGPRR